MYQFRVRSVLQCKWKKKILNRIGAAFTSGAAPRVTTIGVSFVSVLRIKISSPRISFHVSRTPDECCDFVHKIAWWMNCLLNWFGKKKKILFCMICQSQVMYYIPVHIWKTNVLSAINSQNRAANSPSHNLFFHVSCTVLLYKKLGNHCQFNV